MAEDTAVLPRGPEDPGRRDGATAAVPTGPPAGHHPPGRTTIAEKVLERLAARAALEVPGVVRHRPGPGVLSTFTTDLPTASARAAGERVELSVTVAIAWEATAHDVARLVRAYVQDRVQAMTGKTVDVVDVDIAALVRGGTDRRVQ